MTDPIQAPELVEDAAPIEPTLVTPTQVRRPWRSTARSLFQALVGIAAMTPLIYQAATSHDPAAATGLAGAAIAISGGVTRVMALPGVEKWLRRFAPFLAAAPKPKEPHHAGPTTP